MTKKNPYVFTIGFNKSIPSHIRAADILNDTKDKAQLIATAVLYYLENAECDTVQNLDISSLRPLITELVQSELKKEIGHYSKCSETDISADVLTKESTMALDINPEITKNAKKALKAFRKF